MKKQKKIVPQKQLKNKKVAKKEVSSLLEPEKIIDVPGIIPEEVLEKKLVKVKKMYFTNDVDKAIVEYNKCTDFYKRNEIYNTRIKKAFEKLAENIINNWKAPYVTETFRNKKVEIISHLILNLDKFSEEKGKAFSYFTYAARNYLIISNEGNYKKLRQEIRIDDDETNDEHQILQIRDSNVENDNIQNEKKEFINLLITFFDKNLHKIFKKKQDLKIAYAILQLIQNYEDIENFNKKNIYILIREMTDSRAQSITKVLNKMKDNYKELAKEYISTGELNMDYGVASQSKLFFK